MQRKFDRLDWRYIDVLLRFGLGPRVRGWIGEIYSQPAAQVKDNGSLYSQFKITNGTSRGCPLSPVIFTNFKSLLVASKNNL